MSIVRTIRRRRFIQSLVPRFSVGPWLGDTGGDALCVQWMGRLLLVAIVRPPFVQGDRS